MPISAFSPALMSHSDTPIQPHSPGAPLTAHRHQAAFGLHQQVIRIGLDHRPVLAVAADVAGDQPRVALAQSRSTQAQPRRGARRQVLQEDVGAHQHALDQRHLVGVLEVERDRLLAAVDPHPVRRFAVHRAVVAAGEVAFGALDLDHPRAGVGQPAAAVRRDLRLFECDDEHAAQRTGRQRRVRAAGQAGIGAGVHGDLQGLEFVAVVEALAAAAELPMFETILATGARGPMPALERSLNAFGMAVLQRLDDQDACPPRRLNDSLAMLQREGKTVIATGGVASSGAGILRLFVEHGARVEPPAGGSRTA
jgi:hypothetical protein